MNKILRLSGKRFIQKSRKNGIPVLTLPKHSSVKLQEIQILLDDLKKVQNFWYDNDLIDGVLISVYYKRIVAKSNRIIGFLSKGNELPNQSIVGAKFTDDKLQHIITHFISKNTLDRTIKETNEVINIFEKYFPNGITSEQFKDNLVFNKINFNKISKTIFKQIIRDTHFVKRFGIEQPTNNTNYNSIITLYNTNSDIKDLLSSIGINISKDRIMDDTTILLDNQDIQILFDKAPYLVSMSVNDLNNFSIDELTYEEKTKISKIPKPKDEPTIGVLDTLFDSRVYFKDWVEYHDEIENNIPKTSTDYIHGTAVSSLIVDAPSLNPNLDDGAGRFKVRHFGIALEKGFSSFSLIRKIEKIVEQNKSIKVWNISLGSNTEINENFMSFGGAILDKLQYKYNIIFVVAGTNKNPKDDLEKIGSPADSLNSLIVNSVDFSNSPASYSRKGPVLSFFTKPDIAYYGGGNGDFINVCEPLGMQKVAGTSFAAPLIARKLGYLIHVLHLSRELAKALIIDSAIKWNTKTKFEDLRLIGNGVVPIKMTDILKSPDDEIKFLVSDISEKWNSFNYSFPVPLTKGAFHYISKATMVYFPKTSRTQGVDYTDTELNIQFGRLSPNGKIKSINDDKQNLYDGIEHYLYEKDARKQFRKWDNVKHIGENFNSRKKAKNLLFPNNPLWGMKIYTTERLKKRNGIGIKFGVVVTLKNIDGENLIDDFIDQAAFQGWSVTPLSVKNSIKVNNKLDEDINFE